MIGIKIIFTKDKILIFEQHIAELLVLVVILEKGAIAF